MHRLIVLLALVSSVALAFDGPRYNSSDYFLFFNWRVQTEDTYRAGTDCDIRFEFGWLNATNHLIWWTDLEDYYGGSGNAFESGRVETFETIVNGQRFDRAERLCATATGSFEDYQLCISHPNILFVNLKPKTIVDKISGGWKMRSLELETSLNYWRNGEWANAVYTESKFYNDGWAKYGGNFNLKMSENGEYHTFKSDAPNWHRRY